MEAGKAVAVSGRGADAAWYSRVDAQGAVDMVHKKDEMAFLEGKAQQEICALVAWGAEHLAAVEGCWVAAQHTDDGRWDGQYSSDHRHHIADERDARGEP